MLTAVMMETDADPGEKLDPELKAEIEFVSPSSLDTGDVKEHHLDSEVVSEPKLKTGAVSHRALAADAVEADNIKAGAVGTPELADDSVTDAKAGTGVVTAYDSSGNPISIKLVPIANSAYDALSPPDTNTFYFISA